MATAVPALARQFPGVPIGYTIRSPFPPGPEALKKIQANLTDFHDQGLNVQVLWRYG